MLDHPCSDVLLVPAALLVVFSWRSAVLLCEKRAWRCWLCFNWRLRTLLQYYTLLYTAFLGLLLNSAFKAYSFYVQRRQQDIYRLEHTPTIRSVLAFAGQTSPQWIKWSVLGAPIATFLSLVIGARHTWQYASAIGRTGNGRLLLSQQRDRTIILINLPVFFSVLHLCSVLHLVTLDSTDATTETSQQLVACSFGVEMFQAYAMVAFIGLLLQEIDRCLRIDSDSSDEEHVHRDKNLLSRVLGAFTMQGVKLFTFTCFLDAIYHGAVVAYYRFGGDRLPAWVTTCGSFIYAMGFLSTFVAMMNVTKVESIFKDMLFYFRCHSKFISVNVMVSIVFVQPIGLRILTLYLDEVSAKMVYYSFICYEVFFLSCFNLTKAWPAHEAWLEHVEPWRFKKRNVQLFQAAMQVLERAKEAKPAEPSHGNGQLSRLSLAAPLLVRPAGNHTVEERASWSVRWSRWCCCFKSDAQLDFEEEFLRLLKASEPKLVDFEEEFLRLLKVSEPIRLDFEEEFLARLRATDEPRFLPGRIDFEEEFAARLRASEPRYMAKQLGGFRQVAIDRYIAV